MKKESKWIVLMTHDEAVTAGVDAAAMKSLRIEITSNWDSGCDSKVSSVKLKGASEAALKKAAAEAAEATKKASEAVLGGAGAPADDPAFSLVEKYTRPSLTMALKLFEFVVDIQGGALLFGSTEGGCLLEGLTKCIQRLHVFPVPLAKFALRLVSKTLCTAQDIISAPALTVSPRSSLFSDPLFSISTLRDLSKRLILVVRQVTAEMAKSPLTSSPSEVYQSLLQTAVMASNLFKLELFERDEEVRGLSLIIFFIIFLENILS